MPSPKLRKLLVVRRYAELVAAQGGTVSKKEYWGLRSLTFRIKKNRKGHYTLLNIDAPPAAVKELERTMSINEDIIRYLTVRVDALEEGPSAVMQRSADKSDRPGDRGDRDQHRDAQAAPDPLSRTQRTFHRGKNPPADQKHERQRRGGAQSVGEEQKGSVGARAFQRRSGQNEAEDRARTRRPQKAGG